MDTRTVEAGEMYSFAIVNVFPEQCTDGEWTDFADAMSHILSKVQAENRD